MNVMGVGDGGSGPSGPGGSGPSRPGGGMPLPGGGGIGPYPGGGGSSNPGGFNPNSGRGRREVERGMEPHPDVYTERVKRQTSGRTPRLLTGSIWSSNLKACRRVKFAILLKLLLRMTLI